MKKSITFTLWAVLTFLLCDQLVGKVTDVILRRSEFRFARLYAGRADADVVVFGNSRAVNGFCVSRLSELTGSKWVNLGYNGMGPALVEALALDYMERYPAPSAVVLEISNIMQGTDSIRDCRLFVSRSKRLSDIDKQVNGSLSVWSSYCQAFAANGEMLMRCFYYMGRSDQTWVNEGKLDEKNSARLRLEAGRRLEGAVIPESVTATKRLIVELQRRNISVWCIVTPYLLTKEDQRHAQMWLEALRDAGGGVRFVNMVDGITDPKMFADPSHLNTAGSHAFTDVLMQEVFKGGAFSPCSALPLPNHVGGTGI